MSASSSPAPPGLVIEPPRRTSAKGVVASRQQPAAGKVEPPSRTQTTRSGGGWFQIYVAASLTGIAGYFLLPPAAQNLTLLASNLIAFGTITACWRRRPLRPATGWLLLAAFPAATAVGNAIYFVNDSIFHVDPFPSLGDAAFLGGYLLLAAGLLRLQHARSSKRDLAAILDTAIISVGFAAAFWVFFMADLLHDPELSLSGRLVAVAYPVADVLVVAVAARFFLTSRRRGPVFAWLAGTVVVMLAADTGFAVLNLLGIYTTGNPIDALILAYNLGWGAVALHRDSGDLTSPPQTPDSRSSAWRLTGLCTASLVAPLVLLVQGMSAQFDDVVILSSAAAVLFLLVVARMAGLVREVEAVLRQRKKLALELEHRAHHDDLTGLANRRMFVEKLHQALETRHTGGTEVLFIDLDRFKAVNDSLGHKAGDDLLTATAHRLLEALTPRDTVARLGGDEFAVLLDPSTPRSLEAVADTLATALKQPVRLHHLYVQVSGSVGHARAASGDTLEDLLHRADLAMYAQKTRIDRRHNNTLPHVTTGPPADPIIKVSNG
jgi:two-component system cell cycle response regulator